ncbi:hypothetical protein CLAIMM_08336 [Cladophialophora immunda]|nr:hypothetical protein CLAIMM_08336 [Cladophialophora immunda]
MSWRRGRLYQYDRKLNRHIDGLDVGTVQPVDTTVFSIAMNGSEARLFVSWKEGDGKYYTQQIDGLLVYRPEHYLLLRRFVRNVIEWGKDNRLARIGAVLDAVLEGPRKRTHDAITDASEAEDAIKHNHQCQKRSPRRWKHGNGARAGVDISQFHEDPGEIYMDGVLWEGRTGTVGLDPVRPFC